MQVRRQNGIPPGGVKSRQGEPLKKVPPQPPFSSFKIIPYVSLPEKVVRARRPSAGVLEKRRRLRHKVQLEKSAMNSRIVEKQIKTIGWNLSDYEKERASRAKGFMEYRKFRMQELGSWVPVAFDLPECRFRDITIKECLTEVCADLNEPMSIWGNWQWAGGEPVTVVHGEFPKFTLQDCVDAGNGFTFSEGWLWVWASISMTSATTVKEIGVTFSGQGYHDADGEDHLIGSNDWGKVKVFTELDIRSVAPGGSYSHLIPQSAQRVQEVDEYNEWGPTSAYPWLPNRRFLPLNLQVAAGHAFLVDYTLSYEVERSDDYNSAACFGYNDLMIRPYIIYETCHLEYRQVTKWIGPMIAEWVAKTPSAYVLPG